MSTWSRRTFLRTAGLAGLGLTAACSGGGSGTPAGETTPLRVALGWITNVEFAGFWIRVVAWLVDYLIGGIVVAVARVGLGPIGLLLLLPFQLLYGPIMESSAWQGTVGKRLCGLAVTDRHDERITFGRAVVRLLAKVLSLIVLGIGFLMIAFHPRKRGLHDIIAGTLVVHR